MKKVVFIALLIYGGDFFFFAQINDPNWKNLIPNYSFEVVEEDFPLCDAGNYYSTSPYSCLEEYWSGVYEWSHPLRVSGLCDFWYGTGVGTANVLPSSPRSGSFRGNGVNGEFLVVPLWYGGLEQGKKYFIKLLRSLEVEKKYIFLMVKLDSVEIEMI